MSEETVRCWLVERSYSDKGLVTLVYATPDGARHYRRQLSADRLPAMSVTAARDVPEPKLESTPTADRERYETEARRVREKRDPEEEI